MGSIENLNRAIPPVKLDNKYNIELSLFVEGDDAIDSKDMKTSSTKNAKIPGEKRISNKGLPKCKNNKNLKKKLNIQGNKVPGIGLIAIGPNDKPDYENPQHNNHYHKEESVDSDGKYGLIRMPTKEHHLGFFTNDNRE